MSRPAPVAFSSVALELAAPGSPLMPSTPRSFSFSHQNPPFKRASKPSNAIRRLLVNWGAKSPTPARNHPSGAVRVPPALSSDVSAMTGGKTQPDANFAGGSRLGIVGNSGRSCDRSVLTEIEPILASILVENCSTVHGAFNREEKKLELVARMRTASQWAAGSEYAGSQEPFLGRQENFETALNAASLLASLASSDMPLLSSIGALPCVIEELVQLLKDDRSKVANICILDVLSALSSLEESALRCIKAGGVTVVADLLSTETRKDVGEKALVVLELLVCLQEGRIAAVRHAVTTISATGKKLLRVSEAATESIVNILWTMFRYSCEDHEMLKQRALEVGIVGKLVVVLQVGCNDATRRRAGRLLRILS